MESIATSKMKIWNITISTEVGNHEERLKAW